MKRSHKTNPAFSLVECVIALGLVTYVLSAMLGLFTIASGNGKASADDTLVSTMTSQVLSDLRRQRFTDLVSNIQDQPTSKVLLFDNSGKLLTPCSASASGAVYQCTQTLQKDTDTLSGTDQSDSQVVNLVQVKLEFRWPTNTANSSNNKVFNASIARY